MGELLAAADKYQLEQKNICEEKLCNSLEIGNSVSHLVLGDMYQAQQLKRMSLQFVVRNMSSVVRSRDWRERLIDHPALMAEVMEAMARKESGDTITRKTPGQNQGQAGQEPQAKRAKTSSTTPIR